MQGRRVQTLVVLPVAFQKDKFSSGTDWLQRFKNLGSITGKAVSGESEAVSTQVLERRLSEKWPGIHASFSAWGILNADEPGILWQMVPNKTRWGEEQHARDHPLCHKHGLILLVEAIHDWQGQVTTMHGKLQEPLCLLCLFVF